MLIDEFLFPRYIAIVNPLRPRMGKRMTLCIAVAIWMTAAVLALPNLLFYKTFTAPLGSGRVRVVCYAAWPDAVSTTDGINSHQEYL